jgi:hypothetical protein
MVVCAYTVYACKQVDETRTANSLAKRALIEANKSFVMFNGINYNQNKDINGMHKRIGINIINSGNSPSIPNTLYLCKPIIRNDENQPVYRCELSDPPASLSAIGPKQIVSTIGPVVSDADLAATRDAKNSIYIFGYINYSDNISVDEMGVPTV